VAFGGKKESTEQSGPEAAWGDGSPPTQIF